MKKHIPNLITLGNLTCGLLGITQVMNNDPFLGFAFMLLGAFLDFFDGLVARMLKVDGELGKQLDSLADVITFGVLPGLIWRFLSQKFGYCSPTGFCINNYVWILIPLGAAYRLAKFNIDTRQTTTFIGVPTPITGIVLASWSWIFLDELYDGGALPSLVNITHVFQNQYFLLYMPLISAFMMVSEYPMLSLKFKKGDPSNKFKIAMLVLGAISIVIFGESGLAVFYFLYILLSFISNFAVQKLQTP